MFEISRKARRATASAVTALALGLLSASPALAYVDGHAGLYNQTCQAQSAGSPHGRLSFAAVQTEVITYTQDGYIPKTDYVKQRLTPQYWNGSSWKNLQASPWYRIDASIGFQGPSPATEEDYWPDPDGTPWNYRPNYRGYRYHAVVQFQWWNERSYWPDELLGSLSVTSGSCRAR